MYGWICPKCGASNSPFISQCLCKYGTASVTSGGSTIIVGPLRCSMCGKETSPDHRCAVV